VKFAPAEIIPRVPVGAASTQTAVRAIRILPAAVGMDTSLECDGHRSVLCQATEARLL